MENISNVAELKSAIAAKKVERSVAFKALKNEFQSTTDSLNPVNLILNSLGDVTSASYQSNKMFGTISGLITGYFTKKIAVGKSNSSLRKVLATALQLGITNFIASHASDAKLYGKIVIEELFRLKSAAKNKQQMS